MLVDYCLKILEHTCLLVDYKYSIVDFQLVCNICLSPVIVHFVNLVQTVGGGVLM